MREPDLRNAVMAFKLNNPGSLIPLTKPAIAMSIATDIPLIRRQAADQGAIKRFSPLVMIVNGLLKLLERRAHLFRWYIRDSHFTLRHISGHGPIIKSLSRVGVNSFDLQRA